MGGSRQACGVCLEFSIHVQLFPEGGEDFGAVVLPPQGKVRINHAERWACQATYKQADLVENV